MKLFTAVHTTDEGDSMLLQRYFQTNDLEVLGELYSRHAEMVYYVCLRYFKEEEKSKDAVMQIFEELVHKVNKQHIKDFPKWLYVVSKNHCLMDIRSRKNGVEISFDEFVESPLKLHPEESYADKEERFVLMERCIERLPEKQKTSIDLFFLREKCYKEIVEMTGYSLKEVKSYIQNGKRNLKNCMEKNDE
ncbi:sigma-70 family RNA polymerase sigma factor [Parapusillimonas sp. SGNA-6]|uniref:RNA polymerase sigma factor n=1 Tax=Parapedobacter sp. SGR-10 TaxID=2710879 RepID=UPI0013D75D4D|nr:sigma-70 family RNA polymerase sigma factor [Parapedobacter sp. SGR-10]NGF55040.1 sigma-70 family RNA polymerase sigma factor [Parapedobacter sp. SGR-10]NGM89823.1 sigma-70 family RNA polymerase sigma factor [Parapusillimonas sp. SGNA-6]